jgi:hypothetical protein
MAPDGKVFLKSEWAPIGDNWPCLSFTKKAVGDRLRREFLPGRDVLIYVGTGDAQRTENPAHRRRLLSAIVVDPSQEIATSKIVPPWQWAESVAEYGRDAWPLSMPVTTAALFTDEPLPPAQEVAPLAYVGLGSGLGRGGVVEAVGNERRAIMELPIRKIELTLSPDVKEHIARASTLRAPDSKNLRREISRVASLIEERIRRSGDPASRTNPQRSVPNLSDLFASLNARWDKQAGRCAICGGAISIDGSNELLKLSADRVDSSNPSYGTGNLQLTHFACNLGKNNSSMADTLAWIEVIREAGRSTD